MDSRHYILKGHKPKAVGLYEWAEWFETHKVERVVAQHTIKGHSVSTVFLGLDHNFSKGGPPILFETMIFGPKGEEMCKRYATWEEAEEGHAGLVMALEGCDPE